MKEPVTPSVTEGRIDRTDYETFDGTNNGTTDPSNYTQTSIKVRAMCDNKAQLEYVHGRLLISGSGYYLICEEVTTKFLGLVVLISSSQIRNALCIVGSMRMDTKRLMFRDLYHELNKMDRDSIKDLSDPRVISLQDFKKTVILFYLLRSSIFDVRVPIIQFRDVNLHPSQILSSGPFTELSKNAHPSGYFNPKNENSDYDECPDSDYDDEDVTRDIEKL